MDTEVWIKEEMMGCRLRGHLLHGPVRGPVISGRKEMAWARMPDEYPCETCGAAVEHWVLLKGDGPRVAEATFCPVCYSDVKRILHTPEKASEAA